MERSRARGRTRRAVAASAVGTLLAASTLVLSASAASADPTSDDPSHACPSNPFHPGDSGPITDPVHHYVEPLIPGTAPVIHDLNCHYVDGVEYMLSSQWVQDVVDTVAWLLSGGTPKLPF